MYYLDAQRGADGSKIYKVKNNFDLPLKTDRSGKYKIKPGGTVHVCLTSDFFLEEADAWRDEAWAMIKLRSDLQFRLQTKRAERVSECLPPDWGEGYANVSLCITAENQRRADERIPILLDLPFKTKSIMCAPMLSEITLDAYLSTGKITLVIVDGENYDGDRPLYYEWVKALYDECREYGVNFSFAGIGNYFVKNDKTYHTPKAYQHICALRSGLQLPPVNTDIPIQPRCKTCKRNSSCNGCKQCGKCR